MLNLVFRQAPPAALTESVAIGTSSVPLVIVRHPRARRYLLRLRADGTVRLTIPRGGSMFAARGFLKRNTLWLEQQLQRLTMHSRKPATWSVGTEILLRGEKTPIETGDRHCVRFGDSMVKVPNPNADLRPFIELHLRKLATRDLPGCLLELAARHGLTVHRVTVRNQRTRWGSCSRRGTISLNWRLIHTPGFVRDYICLHELAHLLEMNHSDRFWRQVERLCPAYRNAELWLKQNSGLLR